MAITWDRPETPWLPVPKLAVMVEPNWTLSPAVASELSAEYHTLKLSRSAAAPAEVKLTPVSVAAALVAVNWNWCRIWLSVPAVTDPAATCVPLSANAT